MRLTCLLVVLLLQCRSILCLHLVNVLSLWCFYRESFPKKCDLGLAKNYRGITLTFIAAKIYHALLRNRIEPKIYNILGKNQNGFRRNISTTSQILTIIRILEGVRAKNLQATLLFVDFTKAFDSFTRKRWNKSYEHTAKIKNIYSVCLCVYIYIYIYLYIYIYIYISIYIT